MRVLALVVLLLFATKASAWDAETYKYVAEQTLLKYFPHCKAQIDEGAVYPESIEPFDARLGESFNQHCDMAAGLGICPAYDAAYCETQMRTCNATTVAGLWIERAKGQCCCEQAFSLAVALNYHLSSLAPMHQIIKEARECHEGFERKISEAIASNQSSWRITHRCTAPNREFSFSSRELADLILNAETRIMHADFVKNYYCDNCTYEIPRKKANGERCAADAECASGYCDVRVGICCAGGTCCPTPGSDAAPCMVGQVCSSEFQCVQKNLANGEVCKTNLDCASRYCAPGSASGTTKYCCAGSIGQSCCASNADCLPGELCENNICMVVVAQPNVSGPTVTGPGEQPPAPARLCPLFLVPLALAFVILHNKQ
ncbi:MAG: hypothetical protein QXG98_02690 [Candidatus Micrarchaeia archaeon]